MSDTDEKTWMEELETALKENCEMDNVTEMARCNVWKMNLNVSEVESKMDAFDDIFDLHEQKVLREDCQKVVSKLGNYEEDKISVQSDLESILTCYCKASLTKHEYVSNNGWIDLMLPLLTLKLPRSSVYNLFEAIYEKYIPRHPDSFHLLRLLILYHDPQLCNFLDSKKVNPELFAKTWFQTLFASSCSLDVVLSMWDLYFQKEDPFFIFFLSLVIIMNASDIIMTLNDESRSNIVEIISMLPCKLTEPDVTDFCALAQYYESKTPTSFKNEWENILFNDPKPSCEKKSRSMLSQALCLPVSAMELILNSENSANDDMKVESVRFFLIDCRPAEQYNAGHPPTAFHLDCDLMLQEPDSFATAVQGLLSCQRQALAAHSKAGGEHLCFLGCGELLADQYTHMVVASFLQKHTKYVSILTGGYKAFHNYLNDNATTYLRDHNENICVVCLANEKLNMNNNNNNNKDKKKVTKETNKASNEGSDKIDIFGKIGAVMKLKSTEVKEKLVEIITNPTSGSGSNNVETKNDRHINRTDKIGKPYRNLTSIFSIDEHHEPLPDCTSHENTNDVVKLTNFLKNPRIVHHVKCQEVTVAGYEHECCLVVTDTHLIALRMVDEKDTFRISVNRELSSIAKITCKKKHPELVTFQYGLPNNIVDQDRFLIRKSSEVTKIISEEIMKAMDKRDH